MMILVIVIVWWMIWLIVTPIRWSFIKLQNIYASYPERTARMTLTAIAGGIFAYLFDLPYVIEISFTSGMIRVILGEIFS